MCDYLSLILFFLHHCSILVVFSFLFSSAAFSFCFLPLLFPSSSCFESHLDFCSLSFPYFRKDISLCLLVLIKQLCRFSRFSCSVFIPSSSLCFLSVMFKTKGAVNLVSNYADLLRADLKTTYRIFTIVAPIFGQKMNRIINFIEQC